MRLLLAASLITLASSFSSRSPLRWTKSASLSASKPACECDLDALPNPPLHWLPPLCMEPEAEPSTGSMVYPLFPLGGVHLPNTQHILNIFEPRYRKMYSDILLSGSRSFAVCMVDDEGRFAEAATVFYLEDIQEVSKETKDQVKYVCKHKCVKRVKLKRVLNPKAWQGDSGTKTDYLRVEVEDIVDDGTPPSALAALSPANDKGVSVTVDALEVKVAAAATEAYSEDIKALCTEMDSLVDLMTSVKLEPRFAPELKGRFLAKDFMEVGPEGDSKVWALASLWQTLAMEQANQIEREGTSAIQAEIIANDASDGKLSADFLTGRLNIPPALQERVTSMTKRIQADMNAKMEATQVAFQQLLQTGSRGERVRLLRRVVEKERSNLQTKKNLRDLSDELAAQKEDVKEGPGEKIDNETRD